MPLRASAHGRIKGHRFRERLLFPKKSDAAVRVALVYPNRYATGMGNLGFQVVYELIDQHPGVVCERAFLPEDSRLSAVSRTGLRTLESGRGLTSFDIVAFSISSENDYLNVVPVLQLAGIEPWRRLRGPLQPLIIAGGPAVFLNPEPIAEFVDLFLLGEAEEMLPEFLALYHSVRASSLERAGLLNAVAAEIRGAYVPALYRPTFDGPRQIELEYRGPGQPRVERRFVRDLNHLNTVTRVIADDAVFGDMMLVEASRGCQWGCRFCAAGFIYRPVRWRDQRRLEDAIRRGLRERKTIGVVGAEIASVPGIDVLTEFASGAGGRLSPSSLKADCVTPRLAAALAAGGNRSVTLAPEAGSERLRRVINKNLTEAEILRAADRLVDEGVSSLKLYFMLGLPTETRDDVVAIPRLTEKIRATVRAAGRKRGGLGKLTVSLNSFSPRPWTPFQWEPMEALAVLRTKVRLVRKECALVPNLQLDVESPREAYLGTLLCRGDRRVARFLVRVSEAGGDWWRVIQEWRRHGLGDLPPPDSYVYRSYAEDELLPWDFIDHGVDKRYLRAERRKAFGARQTAPCDTSTCTSCAACPPPEPSGG